jgi:hypothetical protein
MDVFYYSNHCRHCPRIIQYINKNGLADRLNCVCVDRRERSPENGATYVQLENGARAMLPPNGNCVPALIQVGNKHTLVTGGDILAYLQERVAPGARPEVCAGARANGEPTGASPDTLSHSGNIVSDSFSAYSESSGGSSLAGPPGRDTGHYAPVGGAQGMISGPEDAYRSNKMSGDDTAASIAALEKLRNADVSQDRGGYPF